MDKSTHVVGIDPGIVHTGVVSVVFVPRLRVIMPQHEAIAGLDAPAVVRYLERVKTSAARKRTYIEGYRPRHHMAHDTDMVNGVKEIKQATGGKVLDNTGIKTVVKTDVLKLLGIYNFNTPTHHQDLRSAARILVLGMMKDPELNELLADIVRDHLNDNGWEVRA